jgi:hypothetical protein
MEWATFKINNESENPELIFIEIFRLASIQAGCAATRLQSDVSLGGKTRPGDTRGRRFNFRGSRGPVVVADSEQTAARILGVLKHR